jgi:acetyl-CoA C-acetyltransferase
MASELPPIDMDEWFWPTELAHDVIRPTLTFAALDTARRARLGIGPEDYRQGEAALLERFSAVAAANDHSWFPIRRSAAEIATVTPVNRIISSPYTKYMVAIMDVDMAAGLLVATHRKADELGIPLDRRIYLRGWSFGRDATHVAERPFLHRSPAMAAVARDALCHAGVSIDDVAHFDLYSCFASSVLFATDALGLHEKDSRGFTVAGGLPYHGGPSSNYTTHAIAAMVQRLREDGQGFGVVSGVGMHMTKHVWGVYGVEPGPVTPPDYAKVQSDIDRYPLRPVVTDGTVDSQGTIACYSVTHDRSGTPVSALVVADLPDGSRAYARSTDGDVLEELGQGERVGRGVRLRPGHGLVNELV